MNPIVFQSKKERAYLVKKRNGLNKYIFILFYMIFFTSFLWSETKTGAAEKDSSYQISAGISEGMLFGTSFELVYEMSDIVVSELRWEMKPLFYLGSFVELSQKNPLDSAGFYAKLGLKLGIPSTSGFMEDRDWNAVGYQLSHFSSSTNLTDSAVLLDLTFGVSIPLFSTIIITPLVGWSYMHYKWTARDGYAQYGKELPDGHNEVWDESLPKIPFYGPVVAYVQDWIIGSVGLSVKYPFLKRFLVEGSFLFSPLIWVYAVDDHFLRRIRFTDDLHGGYFLEPALSFSFFFNQKMRLSLQASYRYTNNTKGFSQTHDIKTNAFMGKSPAGAEYQVWDTGISFTYSF